MAACLAAAASRQALLLLGLLLPSLSQCLLMLPPASLATAPAVPEGKMGAKYDGVHW